MSDTRRAMENLDSETYVIWNAAVHNPKANTLGNKLALQDCL